MALSLSLLPARRAGAQPDRTGGIWLITLTDLVGLMLAFFIMMYAMSKLDAERWGRMAASAGGEAAATGAAAQTGSEAPPPSAVPAPPRGRDTGYLAALLPQKLAAEPALAGARVVPGPGRVAIVMPLDAVADGGTGVTAPTTLAALSAVIAALPNTVRVEASLRGAALKPQDWTEAAARAAAVAAGLAAAGYARPLETRAYVVPEGAAPRDTIAIVILD